MAGSGVTQGSWLLSKFRFAVLGEHDGGSLFSKGMVGRLGVRGEREAFISCDLHAVLETPRILTLSECLDCFEEFPLILNISKPSTVWGL
jgi:hypothetical protein